MGHKLASHRIHHRLTITRAFCFQLLLKTTPPLSPLWVADLQCDNRTLSDKKVRSHTKSRQALDPAPLWWQTMKEHWWQFCLVTNKGMVAGVLPAWGGDTLSMHWNPKTQWKHSKHATTSSRLELKMSVGIYEHQITRVSSIFYDFSKYNVCLLWIYVKMNVSLSCVLYLAAFENY